MAGKIKINKKVKYILKVFNSTGIYIKALESICIIKIFERKRQNHYEIIDYWWRRIYWFGYY